MKEDSRGAFGAGLRFRMDPQSTCFAGSTDLLKIMDPVMYLPGFDKDFDKKEF